MRDKVLQAIIDYIEKHQYPPTYAELMNMTGIKSKATVYHHIHKLIEDGLIETDAKDCSSRAIRVVGYKFVKVD